MNHLGTKTIETNRLILRKFKEGDAIFAYKNWTSEDAVTKYLTWQSHSSVSVTKSIVDSWIGSYENENFYQWAIVLKQLSEPIGSISVVKIKERVGIVEIGYCIGSKWWNQGIVSEAFAAIISFLFKEVKVSKIQADHDPKNTNSGKVMIKCGLKYEGTIRQSEINNSGIVDAVTYGILLNEYEDKAK